MRSGWICGILATGLMTGVVACSSGQRAFGVAGCPGHLGRSIIGGPGDDLCCRQPSQRSQFCEPG
jgi:hypothetical protein